MKIAPLFQRLYVLSNARIAYYSYEVHLKRNLSPLIRGKDSGHPAYTDLRCVSPGSDGSIVDLGRLLDGLC